MRLGERISARMADLGVSQSALARKIGVTQQAVGKLINGPATTSRHLHLIARELQTTPQYLMGETSDPTEGALPVPTPELIAEQLDLVFIPEIDMAYGLGGTFIDIHVEPTTMAFPRSWLRAFTPADPKHLYFARGAGDSMEPTIMDQDIVLIDRSQMTIRQQDRIWAITYGQIGAIKRVRAMADGTYKIMSDKTSVSDEVAVDGEMHVVGRVVGVIRKL